MFSSTFIESNRAPPWKSMADPAPHRGELLLGEADDRLAEDEHVAGVGLRRGR